MVSRFVFTCCLIATLPATPAWANNQSEYQTRLRPQPLMTFDPSEEDIAHMSALEWKLYAAQQQQQRALRHARAMQLVAARHPSAPGENQEFVVLASER